MQYADQTQPDPMMRPRIRRRMLEGMGGGMGDDAQLMDPIRVDKPLAGPSGMPKGGNTGIAGGMPRAIEGAVSAGQKMLPAGTPSQKGLPGMAESATSLGQKMLPAGTPATKTGATGGGTYQDVLQGAIKSNLGTIHAAQGDTARKAAAESVIRGVLPQLEAMGVVVEDVRNEKIKIGGRWYDLLRDVEGDAAPQFLDVTDPATAVQGGQGGQDDAMRGMGGTQTSLIDQIRASIMQLMGNGQGVG